jgi:hypothetical protein
MSDRDQKDRKQSEIPENLHHNLLAGTQFLLIFGVPGSLSTWLRLVYRNTASP